MKTQVDVEVTAALNQLADAIDPNELGVVIADMVIREIPELDKRADDDLRQTTRLNASRSLLEIWDRIRTGADAFGISPPREGIVFAHELVHRGIELGPLLRAYRLGHALVEDTWERTADELALDPDVRRSALSKAFRYFFAWVDAVCVDLTHAYAEERARWVRGAAAVRTEMVQALLAGDRIPAAKASAALGYDVTLRHLAFIVWADPDAPDPGSAGALEGIAAEVARVLSDGGTLLMPVGNWVVWGWTAVGSDAGGDETERLDLPRGIRVALGHPADGEEGFVSSHEEAMQARTVAGLLGRRSRSTVRHHSVALLGLLTTDPRMATRFVDRELGALGAETDLMARLRATLRVYFEENASPARTSRRLSINKNTVLYRVAKAEEVLGHRLAERRVELEVALRLADVRDGLRDAAALPPTGHTA